MIRYDFLILNSKILMFKIYITGIAILPQLSDFDTLIGPIKI